jgi:HD-GYP domain-containing protein (c-di-GMP phosphodiesterase class II)
MDDKKSRNNKNNLYEKAYDYLKEVIGSVRQEKTFSLDPGFQIIEEMIAFQSLSDTLFLKSTYYDDPTDFVASHHVNVAVFTIKMAGNLGWKKERQVELGAAALLHDVGMGLIPDEILFKENRLSDIEHLVIKQRSNYAHDILSTFKNDHAYLAECALHVNERFDGSGYPLGIQGDDINEYAQIIGLADLYEALTHPRPHREKFPHFSAVKEIIKSGKNTFQKPYLKALLNVFSVFPIYSYVRLNSNAIGRVIETYPARPIRPKIQIVFDAQNRRQLTKQIVNLQENQLLHIVDYVYEKELQGLSNDTISEKNYDA